MGWVAEGMQGADLYDRLHHESSLFGLMLDNNYLTAPSIPMGSSFSSSKS